ncbi:hypothetical protein [Nocardia transvalensis]|uniref:hypothetical protein n=1 Tax=Nocardia transvalensis TaxID=37333 RepID=UPI0002DEE65D|nr:hypothetical protein [Nocardia transvalensis]
MGGVLGAGARQQAILRLLDDDKPRTARMIAHETGILLDGVCSSLVPMRNRGWVEYTGDTGYYRAPYQRITPTGRTMIIEDTTSTDDP